MIEQCPGLIMQTQVVIFIFRFPSKILNFPLAENVTSHVSYSYPNILMGFSIHSSKQPYGLPDSLVQSAQLLTCTYLLYLQLFKVRPKNCFSKTINQRIERIRFFLGLSYSAPLRKYCF